MTDKQVIEEQKPLSIDDLFNHLDNDLRQENYDAWSNRINEVLNSQLVRYASMINEIKQRLGKEFNVNNYSYFDLFNVSSSDGIDSIHIKQKVLVRFSSSRPPLENVIDEFRSKIKFDNLPSQDRARIEGVFKEQDVKTATYNYHRRNLEGYNTNLSNYLRSMNELIEAAKDVLTHSYTKPNILKWEDRKAWNKKLNSLLGTLGSKYKKAHFDYMLFIMKPPRPISFPASVEGIQELNQIQEELRARDPESRIDIKKDGDGVYVILMESTKEYPVDTGDEECIISPRDKYRMDKPSLRLYGEYEIEPGVKEKVDIDLTKERREAIFFNTVKCGNSGGLVEKLQVELGINIPKNEGFKLNSLNVVGLYELPYLAETKTVEKSLTTENVKLI